MQTYDQNHQYNILIAEDCPDTRVLIEETLSSINAKVKATENGKECLDEAIDAWDHHHPYDLIMLDLQMPVMDGTTTARLLREKGYKLPIVAMTARTSPEDREETRISGCDAFISKLSGIKTIISEVNKQLSRPRKAATVELPVLPIVPKMIAGCPQSATRALKLLDELEPRIKRLKTAVSEFDFEQIRQVSMTLSPFSLLGYDLFSTYIEKIQRAASNKNMHDIKKILPSLERCAKGMIAGTVELCKVAHRPH